MFTNSDDNNTVRVYKVCLPSYYAWPSKNIILNVSYSEDDAKKFIKNYPNIFLQSWLKIEIDVVKVPDTD